MKELRIGAKAPDFELQDQYGKVIKLSDFKGKYLAVYFYPKDDTPACTTQGCLFRDKRAELLKNNCEVVGISMDSVKSHQKFSEQQRFNFPLLADEDGKVCNAYGVYREKTLFGRNFLGIVRATFLLDENAKIVAIWPEANALTNAHEVLNYFIDSKNDKN